MTTPDKPAPRCETCPFHGDDMRPPNGQPDAWSCRNVHSGYQYTTKGFWCSEHPDAPPTRMEKTIDDGLHEIAANILIAARMV